MAMIAVLPCCGSPVASPRSCAASLELHDACNTVVSAVSTSVELKRVLQQQLESSDGPRFVFFDLDECVVMPATPFIDGLPGTDALVSRLSFLYGEHVLSPLRRRMVEAYYSAPVILVDAGLPALISHLRARSVRVYGLTSRGASEEQFEYAWHNAHVVNALVEAQVVFSQLPPDLTGVHGDNTAAGGILYAGGEQVDKAVIMHSITRGKPATLIDNSARKLRKATSLGRACVHGIHFTAAWAREASDSERRRWIHLQRLNTAEREIDTSFDI